MMGSGSPNNSRQRRWTIALLLLVIAALAPTRSWGLAQVSIGNGPASGDGSYLNAQLLADNLVFTSIFVQADSSIDFVDTVDLSSSSFGTPHRSAGFTAPTINVPNNLNFSTSGTFGFTATTLNLGNTITSGGSLITSARLGSTATQVNVLNNGASIQQALDLSSRTQPGAVHVNPGTYVEAVTETLSPPGLTTVTLDSAGLQGAFAVTGLVGISLANGSNLSLSGGTTSGDVVLSGSGNMLEWRGGQIGGLLSVAAGSSTRVYGSGFEVDSGTGFVAVPYGVLSPGTGQLRGVLASSEPFTVSFDATGTIELVPPGCGNSVVDAGEQCDDGNNVDGDCCSATCQYEAPSSPCPGGTCDGAGACFAPTTTTVTTSTTTTSEPATTSTTSSTATTSSTSSSTTTSTTVTPTTSTTTTTLPSPPCTNGAVATKPKLTASKLLAPPGDDKLSISGEAVIPTTPTLDVPGRGVRVLLTSAADATLLDVTIPPGAYDAIVKTGWKANGAQTAWTYKGLGTATSGIQQVSVKLNKAVPGGIRFSVKAKNGTYPITAIDVPVRATLVLDVPAAATGQCVHVRFPAAPPAKPSCALSGATLKCK